MCVCVWNAKEQDVGGEEGKEEEEEGEKRKKKRKHDNQSGLIAIYTDADQRG